MLRRLSHRFTLLLVVILLCGAVLPPGTPKERVQVLQTAMRNIFKDPEFPAYYKKLVAEDASPLGPDELTRIVAEIPRDNETLDLLRTLYGAEPLPAR